MIERAAAGFVLALLIALLARRARALTSSGVTAAVLTGTACVAAGWDWGIALIAFFVTSSALSRAGEERKARRTERIVAKGGARDARQVLANGGIFGLAALGAVLVPWSGWAGAAAGALAAAASDTWATEIGTLAGGVPRSIIGGAAVPAGTSGGVTLAGVLGAIAGAAFIGLVVWLVGWPPRVALAAVAGGIAGSTADSVLGAAAQQRRWCPACEAYTERPVHDCGTLTRHAGGQRWMDNDVVNMASTIAGALVSLMIAG